MKLIKSNSQKKGNKRKSRWSHLDWSIYQEGSAVQVVRFCTRLIVTVTQLRAPVLTLILLLAEMYMTDREANFQWRSNFACNLIGSLFRFMFSRALDSSWFSLARERTRTWV
jgi:hypothetical protein